MKYLLNLLLLTLYFFSSVSSAQVQDDFGDNEFISNPSWSGNDTSWTVVSGMLRSNGPAVTPSTIWLSTPSSLIAGQWEFFVNPRCATSSGNYMNIALISDEYNISSAYNGYYVMIGNSTDEISLYRKDSISSQKIIDGPDGMIPSSSNNPLRIKVIRDSLGVFILLTDNAGNGNWVFQGTATDNLYTSSQYCGIAVTYSAANNTNYFMDDFYAGPVISDTVPPLLLSCQVISSGSVDLFFNESIDLSSLQSIFNYTVDNGIGNPVQVLQDNADHSVLHLQFTGSFTSGVIYEIAVSGIEDTTGNAMTPSSCSFTYYDTAAPYYRSVIINELLPDYSPVSGLPAAEYIELHNRSQEHFYLGDWTVSDGTSTALLPHRILQAGGYVVLCSSADTALFAGYGNITGISPWPSLNNSSDTITLRDNNNVLIDRISYSTSWYKDSFKDDGGWSLELINPDLDCSGESNWKASEDPGGGTPGFQNSVWNNAPDITPPKILETEIISQNQVRILFSENMDSLSLINASWNISAGITLNSVFPLAPEFTSADLFFSAALDTSVVYFISCQNASDCAGNFLQDSTRFGIGTAPSRYDILITEIFPDPDETNAIPEYEFIELYNRTSKIITLSGCTLSDQSSSSAFSSSDIFPGEYLIVCNYADAASFSSYGRATGLSAMPSLNNSSDKLFLRRSNGTLIHSVEYTADWYGDELKSQGGWTLEMKDPGNPCGEENNWSASLDLSGGTPGTTNSNNSSNPDTMAPVPFLAEALGNAAVIVYFNEIIDSATIHSASFQMDQGRDITSRIYYGDKKVLLTVYPDMQFNTIYTLTINNCGDCVGNTGDAVIDFAMPQEAGPGDIVINEILFDPLGAGADFVELYNRSDKIISLKNWQLANFSADTINNHKVISVNGDLLYPGSYKLLTGDTGNICEEYSLSCEYRKNFLLMKSFPSYSSTYGQVFLITDNNEICDQFEYSEEMHFPLLLTTDGVSLERINPEQPSHDWSNWHSAAERVGFATPGYHNSQYFSAQFGEELFIEPSIFSPDNDGYQDVLTISYQLESGGWVGSMAVFDHEGRKITDLLRNELLGLSGVITWDGINYRGEKADTGIYIVYFELFDESGSIINLKKAIVLAAKI